MAYDPAAPSAFSISGLMTVSRFSDVQLHIGVRAYARPGMTVTGTYDPAFSALSISTLSTLSILSGVTGPTSL